METRQRKERVVLVIIFKKRYGQNIWSVEEESQEMKELVSACGGRVVDCMVCPLEAPEAKYFIREGKLEDLAALCAARDADTVIFSHDLKGSQQRNLERRIKLKIIDRTQLILDIFARHASSKEGQMQVELAQLEYLLPRLTGKGVELSRLGGGIGTLGPGETKLEVDRRRIAARIVCLKRGLNNIASDRALRRKKRKDRGVPLVSLVGYTNAGKSTLLNALTRAQQQTHDGVFTTLDSLSRQLVLPNHQKAVLSDTVGFIHDLPHHLVESFKATLEEVREADLLLRVLDVSQKNFKHRHQAVSDVLRELGAYGKPTIIVFNKIDQMEDKEMLRSLVAQFKGAVAISAKTGENLSALLEKIMNKLSDLMVEIDVDVPIKRMDLVHLAHNEGDVISIKYYQKTMNIRALIPKFFVGKFRPFLSSSKDFSLNTC